MVNVVPGAAPPAQHSSPAGAPEFATLTPAPQAFRRHLRRASELVGTRRLPEAELELSRALTLLPHDLRALELLALVRFKLGRLADARQAYRSACEVAPEDPGARLNLGLIALKLEWFEDAIVELEAAARLGPGDARVWSYLGHAYARAGESGKAAAVFRRAGQPELAEELERTGAPAPSAGPLPALTTSRLASATGFVVEHLVPGPRGDEEAGGSPPGDVLRFSVGEGGAHVYVRQAAVLAAVGEVRMAPARKRERGQLTDALLGTAGDPFVRCEGAGELLLTPPPNGRGLVSLGLEDDVIYLRHERVVAFDGAVVWEAGRIPGAAAADLLQFRGSGRVVLDAARGEVAALRLPEGEQITVPGQRLVGWLGRVIVHGVGDLPPGTSSVACEGEGVLLLSRHGDPAQPVHLRAQPGDDGTGADRPGRPLLHR